MNPWKRFPIEEKTTEKTEPVGKKRRVVSRWPARVGAVAFFAGLAGYAIANLPDSFGACLFFTMVTLVTIRPVPFPNTPGEK